MSARAPQRILIIKPSSLGDIVHGLPVLAALRRRFPDAYVAWLAARPFAPLLQGHPLLNEIIVFDRKHFGKMWFNPRSFVDFWRFVAGVRRRRFDWVIDLQGLFRSGFLAAASGASLRAGFSNARECGWIFYTKRVRATRNDHAVARNLALARAIDLPLAQPEFPLPVHEGAMASAAAKLQAAAGRPLDAYIAVLPGARWQSKQWPVAHVASLLDRLHERGHPAAVLLGAPDESPLAASIVAACRVAQPANLVGQTSLTELTALLQTAEHVVAMDSGPMHIAAALGRPLTAIFGPTNPHRTGPYTKAGRALQLDLPCVPCYRRTCPLGHHNCLRTMEPQMVVDAIPPPVHSTELPLLDNPAAAR